MTPLQFANQFCANLHTGNECLGIGIRDDGAPFRFRPVGECTVSAERCSYFETCVAPTVRTMESTPTRASCVDAVEAYLRRLKTNLPAMLAAKRNVYGNTPDEDLPDGNLCATCKTPIPKRQTYCQKCSKNRRRTASR